MTLQKKSKFWRFISSGNRCGSGRLSSPMSEHQGWLIFGHPPGSGSPEGLCPIANSSWGVQAMCGAGFRRCRRRGPRHRRRCRGRARTTRKATRAKPCASIAARRRSALARSRRCTRRLPLNVPGPSRRPPGRGRIQADPAVPPRPGLVPPGRRATRIVIGAGSVRGSGGFVSGGVPARLRGQFRRGAVLC